MTTLATLPEFTAIRVAVAAPIMTVTLNRPQALNAITPTMLEELCVAFEAIDESIAAVVLTGEGRAFSAGVDLKALAELGLAGGEVGGLLNGPARRLTALIESVPAVVIAKVNGFCFTGALELAIACDIVVVANEAKLGDTHAKWGLRPTWGMSQRLPCPGRPRSCSRTEFHGAHFHWGRGQQLGACRVRVSAD